MIDYLNVKEPYRFITKMLREGRKLEHWRSFSRYSFSSWSFLKIWSPSHYIIVFMITFSISFIWNWLSSVFQSLSLVTWNLSVRSLVLSHIGNEQIQWLVLTSKWPQVFLLISHLDWISYFVMFCMFIVDSFVRSLWPNIIMPLKNVKFADKITSPGCWCPLSKSMWSSMFWIKQGIFFLLK